MATASCLEHRDISGWTVRLSGSQHNDAPGLDRTVASAAFALMREQPDRIAFWFDGVDKGVTFREIGEEALALAAAMQRMGLVAGDVVSFQLPNWRQSVAITIAAAALGLVVNPVSPIYRAAELRFMLSDAGSKVIFVPEQYRATDYVRTIDEIRSDLPALREVVVVGGSDSAYDRLVELGRGAPPSLADVDLNAVKLLMYTSGTTGAAKGVLHSHRSINSTHADYRRAWQVNEDDCMLMPSPVTHGTGFILGIELPFFTQASVSFLDLWSPAKAIEAIGATQATMVAGATVFLTDLLEEAVCRDNGLPCLRLFVCGGAAVSSDLIYRAAAATAKCRATRVYGATEAPLITKGFGGDSPLQLSAETDGMISGYDVKIVDGQGRRLGAGQDGEIRVAGTPLMIGYTDVAVTGAAFDEDGYFKTGDIGHLTADGALVITGRIKDLIIRAGENLSPKEIEDAIELHSAVREAAVVGSPHPRLGEMVVAYLIVREGAVPPSLEDLAGWLTGLGLARQKIPQRLECVDEFPRTASGKVRKDVLRTAAATAATDLADAAPAR